MPKGTAVLHRTVFPLRFAIHKNKAFIESVIEPLLNSRHGSVKCNDTMPVMSFARKSSDGAPVDDATVRVRLTMPEHGDGRDPRFACATRRLTSILVEHDRARIRAKRLEIPAFQLEGDSMTYETRLLVAAFALAGTLIAGCTKSSNESSSSTSQSSPAAASSAGSSTTQSVAVAGGGGDAAHGKAIFAANCASCHGVHGTEGGVGPSLKGEKSKKDQAAAVAWIKNPQPPMPKLYPSPLSDKDVNDVAAFVESL
jgi:mono/diheme cytochrome c family protein